MDGKLRNMTSVYITNKSKNKMLLYRQGGRVVNNVWIASAGGHFEECELNDAKACVLRELKEELGLGESDIDNLSLRYITLRRANGEIRQSYFFFAELIDINKGLASDEGMIKWFDFSELPEPEMPFSAKFVIEHYLKIGHETDEIYGGVSDGEKVIFVKMTE